MDFKLDLIKKSSEFIGLDIGTSSIKLVRLKAEGDNFTVLDFSLHEIPAKVQETKDLAALKTIIQDIFKEKGLAYKGVNSMVSGVGLAVKRTLVPDMSREELLGAIKWALKDQVPFDLDKSSIEFEITGEAIGIDGIKKKEVMVVAVNEDSLKRHITLIKESGLESQGVSVLSYAISNFVKIDNSIRPNQISALIDIGADKTEIMFFKGKQLQFVRQITTAANTITRALTGVVVSFPDKIELSFDEAEKIKRTHGIPEEDARMLSDSKIPPSKILMLMRPVLERLLNEIKRSLDYYRQEFKQERIDRLILCGGGARLKKLDEFLAKGLSDIKVELISMPKSIYCEPVNQDKFKELLPSLAVALGLALGKGEGLNFLPKELRAQVKQIREIEKSTLRVISVVISVVFIFSLLWMNQKMNTFKRHLVSLSQYWSMLEKITEARRSLDKRKLLYDEIIVDQPDLYGILKSISDIIPKTAELNSLVLNQEKRELDLKGMLITTEYTTEMMLADFLLSLEGAPYFTKATLISSSKTEKLQLPAAEFELVVNLAKSKK
ncbi:MAG: type IV pilus assembly protein PilM [Candidatus Omnitrophota bacterium]